MEVKAQGNSAEAARAAADWFTRLQDDSVGEQDFQQWHAWLSASEQHRRAYRQIEDAWRLIGEVAPTPWPHPAELQPDSQGPKAEALGPIPGHPARRRQLLRLPLAWAAGVGLIAAGVLAALMARAPEPTYSTRTAEHRSVRLPDGSRVTLGGLSRITLTFDTRFRQVRLDSGEAYFEITPDPLRPFTVISQGSEIRVLGTSFNVSAVTEQLLVSVTEGRVSVATPRSGNVQAANYYPPQNAAIMVSAGEQVAIAAGTAKKYKTVGATATTWLQGRFEYRGEELTHVVEDLNRYADRRIVIADERLGRLRYSGTVFPDHLDEWLDGLTGVLPVAVRDRGAVRELIPAP